jgi:NodT family efflux transporter outer membrane factor (OMF) lipoprotein
VLTAVLLLAAGCDLGPDYKRPELEIPQAYPATAETAAKAWPEPEWWRGFDSPDLNDLIAQARQNNFDIQAAIARVEQADAQVRISGAPLLPTVTGTGSYQWSRTGTGRGFSNGLGTSSLASSSLATSSAATAGTTTGTTLTSLTSTSGSGKSHYVETRTPSLTLGVSYELDFWGRLRAQQDSAEASAMYSRFDQETVALTTVTSVANTWFQALAFQDRVDVAERNLRDATEILDAIRGRLSVGTASELDVSQQAALVAGIRASLPGLRSQLAQQVNGLGILVGRSPQSLSVHPGTLNALSLPEVGPGVPSELLQRRPDIASAEAQLIAATADIRSARANFFPQITLTGSGGVESTALTSLFSPGSMLLSLTGQAAQTIFDNGLKGGQYDQYKGKRDELVADYRKAVVQAFTDVQNGLDTYRLATEQEALEREAVRTAQRAADIAKAQVAAGTSDIVTALQAENTLFSDLDTLAQVRLSRFQALLNLYKALGGGWKQSDVPVPPSSIYHGVL